MTEYILTDFSVLIRRRQKYIYIANRQLECGAGAAKEFLLTSCYL